MSFKQTVNLESMLTELSRSEIENPAIRFVMEDEEDGYVRFCTCCDHEGCDDFVQINIDEDVLPESLHCYLTDYDEAFCVPVDDFIDAFDGKIKGYEIGSY